MVFQLSSSSDINILDLGWVASIWTMFSEKMPKDLGTNYATMFIEIFISRDHLRSP
jgi:hypothetical protein